MQTMEYMDEVTPGEILIFRLRPSGTSIDIGRPQTDRLDGDIPEDERQYVWDRNISLRDYSEPMGTLTIPRTYEAFKAKCLEWLEDMREADSL